MLAPVFNPSHRDGASKVFLDGEIISSLRPKGFTSIATLARDLNVTPRQIRRQITRINRIYADALTMDTLKTGVRIEPGHCRQIEVAAELYWAKAHEPNLD